MWLEDALQPLEGELKPATLKRLTHALAASVGVDTFIGSWTSLGCPRSKQSINSFGRPARS
jgi:hypothetical protein